MYDKGFKHNIDEFILLFYFSFFFIHHPKRGVLILGEYIIL